MQRFAVLAAAVAALTFAWWLWQPSDVVLVSEPVASTPAPVAASDAAAATAAAPITAPAAATTSQRTEAPAPEAAAAAIGPECVLRGRCVDTAGNPIAAVTAKLMGWGANSERIDAWCKDHEEPKRSNEQTTTGADGVFAFRFWPPPPFQFALDLSLPGYGSMSGRWGQLDPGSTRDLGDIVMPAGTLLRGRVVDSNGALATDLAVHFNAPNRGREQDVAPRTWEIGYVRTTDGTFTGRWPMPPGTYRLEVPHRTIVSPLQIVLDGTAGEHWVDVVIEALDDQKAIRGTVVDEQGAPVRSAMVNAATGLAGQHWIISTDKQGAFRVPKPAQNAPEAVQLTFSHDSFESLTTAEQFAWGRNDVRVTLQRRPSLEVLVVADADGSPVEDYQLRVLWPGNSTMHSSRDAEVRGGTHHDGGRLSLEGVSRGAHLLMVEPRDAALSIGRLEVDVAVTTTTPLVVRLPATAQRELRLQFADGTPVAGARVQLADASMLLPRMLPAVKTPLTIMPAGQWAWNSAHTALELLAGATDEQGRFALRGPGNRDLLLRLPGPPNTPQEFADVRLDVAEPLVVTVSTGARLDGSVRPVEMVAEMRRLAGLPATAGANEDRGRQPHVQLLRGEALTMERFPSGQRPALVAADGTFALDGIPPGSWTVQLCWAVGDDRGWSSGHDQPCGRVVLQDGATAHFDIDASFLIPGELEGTVLRNGTPLANTTLNAVGTYGKDALGNDISRWLQVTTDGDGRFHLRARAGEYRVLQQLQQKTLWSQLKAAESAYVVAQRTVAQTFHLDSGTVRVRLLDAAGLPVAGVAIELRDVAGQNHHKLVATGADGWTGGEVEPGTYRAAVLPRRLQDQKALSELWRNNVGNPDPLAPFRIALGDVAATSARTQEFTLRLPADW